ncbi:MAG: Yip1 family protein [Acidobacteriota bacterium]
MNENNPTHGENRPEAVPAEAPTPSAPAPAPIAPLQAVTGAFLSPGETFKRIVERHWTLVAVPLVLIMIFNVVSVVLMRNRVDMKQFVRDQIRQSRFADQLSDAQIEEAAEREASRPAAFTAFFACLFLVVTVLFLAALFWLVLLAFGFEINFKRSLLAVGFAMLPMTVAAVLFIVILFVKDPNSIDIQNALATNPAALLDRESTSKPLYALLQSLDLFKAWMIFLLSVGLAAAARCRVAPAAAAVVVLYFVWVGVRVALAAIF